MRTHLLSLFRKFSCMHKQCVPGSTLPPLQPGNEATSNLDDKMHRYILVFVVGVTHYCIKLVDDTDSNKGLEMPRTEPFVCLSGTHIQR